MIFWRAYQMLVLSLKLGKKIPFKIHNKASIKIRPGATFVMGGRLNVGHKRHEHRISILPVNLYFGKNAQVELGHSVSIGQGVNIIVKDNAKLAIGNGTYFTSDMHIEVENSLSIGSNCAISWGTTIIDSHHHRIIISDHSSEVKGKVTIGDHVWIGCNCTILKDTVIGDHSVVAAGSVVKGVFPPNSLIAGNPAKVIKQNVSWQ